MISERIQNVIHSMETGTGSRIIWKLVGALSLLALIVLYDVRAYKNFVAPEAMDAAQVARNLEEGHGFSTQFIRPFSLYLIQKHNHTLHPDSAVTNFTDFAQINSPHPDLANAPVYPVVLAGLFKTFNPPWPVNLRKSYWSQDGRFQRYKPEFIIAIMNQLLLLAVVGLTFLIARKLFDAQAAWLAAGLTLASDLLWKFSVSGLSTMLVMVILLGLVLCLIKIEELGRSEFPDTRRLFMLAFTTGLLLGVGMLTRYAFGWMLVPAVIFLAVFGGTRRMGLVVAMVLVFAVILSPWIARNLHISGTLFGTAGYALAENTDAFSGSQLMQSINPSLQWIYLLDPYTKKFLLNSRDILQINLLHLAEGWGAILFFVGLLLGLRNQSARRLRYFVMLSLGVLICVQALGATSLSSMTPDINSENLLVLLTPLIFIFGAAFFLTMVDQMKTPGIGMRYLVIGLLVAVVSQPLAWTIIVAKAPTNYPPYYPPEIQKLSGWMQPDEFIMSDVPWAVAWYGDRTCTWLTLNDQSDYFAINDYIKPINSLYLTVNTLNVRLFSDCLQGGPDSWSHLVLQAATSNKIPTGFPLRVFAYETLQSGMFLTDHKRW